MLFPMYDNYSEWVWVKLFSVPIWRCAKCRNECLKTQYWNIGNDADQRPEKENTLKLLGLLLRENISDLLPRPARSQSYFLPSFLSMLKLIKQITKSIDSGLGSGLLKLIQTLRLFYIVKYYCLIVLIIALSLPF